MADATQEQLTFEQGYEELKKIVSELDRAEVSVHDMFEGFRRGKGLETALRGYLSSREGELTEIAEGKNLPRFEIVAPSASDRASSGSENHDSPVAPISTGSMTSDDDIPF
ncbi:MAG: exodeoxyribonuclease VII small subunit [Solirubrobacteraceae bacterium]